jgi:hypothetical protein
MDISNENHTLYSHKYVPESPYHLLETGSERYFDMQTLQTLTLLTLSGRAQRSDLVTLSTDSTAVVQRNLSGHKCHQAALLH